MEHAKIQYTSAVDTYAFGVVMYELLTHLAPWDGVPSDKQITLVVEGTRPDSLGMVEDEETPEGWCEMMRQCWAQAYP